MLPNENPINYIGEKFSSLISKVTPWYLKKMFLTSD